ncbi:hypothetical protein OKW21_005035 [Catalinimonas alkaloidigena]|uniref:BrxE family protein n=1 Tax=Catalinimonas alkaloidigena TaxID=1075417 RepID=UPI002404E0CC|nr:BrxE family protein [Catalinimonas alkaloidigena]MDF9799772.1 hypothetical protein [Catalinimonas alkaloidigena]
MKLKEIQQICETRMLIGFLGEKQQASWWNSSFLSSSSKMFLSHIFPNSIVLAQYSSVCKTASIVHDEHIGIGKHYHLYRLPDSIEKALFKFIQDKSFGENFSQYTASKDSAFSRLQELGVEQIQKAEGPVAVGDYSDKSLGALINISRSHYNDALTVGYKTFPYMRC